MACSAYRIANAKKAIDGSSMVTYEIVPFDRERFECLSDFLVKSESKVIKCHKFKLAWNSEVFFKMFQCNDYNENRKGEVLIEDFSDDTVEDFVKFLYQGKLEDEERYTTELLTMAHKYQVEAMKDICSDYLVAHITNENVAQAWLISEACEIDKLVNAVHVFLAENWNLKKECDGIADVVKYHPEYMLDLFTHVMNKVKTLEDEKSVWDKKMMWCHPCRGVPLPIGRCTKCKNQLAHR